MEFIILPLYKIFWSFMPHLRRIYVLRNEKHYVVTAIVLSSVRPLLRHLPSVRPLLRHLPSVRLLLRHLPSASKTFHGYLQMLSSKSEFLENRLSALHMYSNIYPQFPHSFASSNKLFTWFPHIMPQRNYKLCENVCSETYSALDGVNVPIPVLYTF
jgi:hypothetical protein